MRKPIIFLFFVFATLNLFAQQEQYEVIVTNVVVPVRVFSGETFIDNLTIDDFELYEDGVLQKIQALYLARKANIERKEETQNFSPQITRRFYLIFQLIEYNPKLAEAIDYFFKHVFLPGDTLTIMTPMKIYNLSPKALVSKSKEIVAKELLNLVRKDTKVGSSNYRSLMRDLKRLVRGISGSNIISGFSGDESTDITGLEFLLPRYRETLEKMEELRLVDSQKLFGFAEQLKRVEGQKVVFFFYEREFRPEIHPRVMSALFSMYQDQPNILGDLQDLMSYYYRPVRLDQELLKQKFADSSVLFNFIFMDREPEHVSGIQMREQSEDIFRIFSDITRATGGVVDTSQTPAAAFKKASTVAESYYLLYYSPLNYVKDGKFKKIEVKVKGKNYRVIHRQGYFAQ